MSNIVQELVKTIGVEGVRAMGFNPDGTACRASFETSLRESVANTMGLESQPARQSVIPEAQHVLDGIRSRLGEGVDITRDHITQYVRATHRGIRMDLVEAACALARTKRADLMEANPLHDPDTGKFTSQSGIVGKKKGSFSLGGYGVGKSKSRVGKRGAKMGKGKDGRTRALINWVSTSRPCGRDARKQGKDIKCSTGKRGGAMEAVERDYILVLESETPPPARWVKRTPSQAQVLASLLGR